MTDHSQIGVGGSTVGRVIACPPSRLVVAETEPQQETEYTRNGTLLHSAMEMHLLGSTDPEILELLPAELHWKYHKAKEIWKLIASDVTVKHVHVELRLHLAPIPGAFGTVDVLIEHHDNTITILDWKFGDGVQVPANSAQNKFYAAAAMTDPETKHLFNGKTQIRLMIVQPTDRNDDHLRIAHTDVGELVLFTARAKWAVENGHDDSLLNAGDHCKFCPVKPVCPKLQELATQALQYDDPHKMTPEQIGEALEMADKLEQWTKSIRDYAHERLEHGRAVDGWKLVPRRATRQWLNEDVTETWLAENAAPVEDDCYTEPKLKSVAQVEKLVTDLPKYLYEKKSSGTTIARTSDPRPEATSAKQIEHAANRLAAFLT